MKKVIVDTNILFSALLGKNKNLRDVILTEKEITFYSCKFVFVELFKYKETIEKKSSLEEDELLHAALCRNSVAAIWFVFSTSMRRDSHRAIANQ